MVVVKWYDARFSPGTYTKEACKDHNMCLFESLGEMFQTLWDSEKK